jgi:molybdate transport system substrate-binding protein
LRSRRRSLLALVALVAAACSVGASPSTSGASPGSAQPSASTLAPGAARVDLTISGAASLQGVLAKVKVAYEAAVPGTTLTISTDSSSALETKIELGAPADVFLSADTANPKKLVDKGLAAGDAVVFAGNWLVIIVPAGNPAGIASPADLAKPGIKVIAAGDSVPITKYATQLVANLAREPGYPADFVAAYTANIVSKEDNVKAAVAKIELGEGDAAIVYVTDATASTKVTSIAVPGSANVQATYAGVVVMGSANVAAAKAFLAWLAGPDGRAILRSFGFLPPS